MQAPPTSVTQREHQVQQLIEWATQEMGFQPTGTATLQHLRRLCRGSMLPVWAFFVERVRSHRTANHVRSNLLVNGHQLAQHREAEAKEAERVALVTRKSELEAETEATQATLHQLEGEMARLADDVRMKEMALASLRRRISDVRQRTRLVAAYTNKVTINTAVVAEYTNRLQCCLSEPTTQQAHDLQHTLDDILEPGSGDARESAVAARMDQEAQVCVERATEQLMYILAPKGNPNTSHGNATTASFPSLDSSTWLSNSIGNVSHVQGPMPHDVSNLNGSVFGLDTVMECGAQRALQALVSCTHRATIALRSATDEANPRAEMAAMVERVQQRKREPKSSRPGHKCVEELLADLQQEHCDVYVATEAALTSAHAFHRQIATLRGSGSQRALSHTGTGEHLMLVDAVMAAEVAAAEERAAVAAATQHVQSLTQARRSQQDLVLGLRERYVRIRRFEEKVEHRQASIRQLGQLSHSIVTQLEASAIELRSFIQSQVVPFDTSVADVVNRVVGFHQRDLQALQGLPLDQLRHTTVASKPMLKKHLSIACDMERSSLMQSLSTSIGYQVEWCSDYLLLHVLRAVVQRDGLRLACSSDISRSGDVHGGSSIHDLVAKAKDQHRVQEHEWLPALQQCIEASDGVQDECGEVSRILNEWWRLPGRFTVPWKKVHGRNVKQWVDIWRTLVSKWLAKSSSSSSK